MRTIGLTGNIGSGKSTAADCFKDLGAKIISADQLARAVVAVNQPAYLEILQLFGETVLLPDLSLNRKRVAEIVFNDDAALKQLNRITHREIEKLREKQTTEMAILNPEATIIYDVPLLFENEMQHHFQKVVLITIEQELQIQRLVKYREFTPEDIQSRIKHQMPQDDKLRLADFIISNNGTVAELKSQVKSVYQEILNLPSLELKTTKMS